MESIAALACSPGQAAGPRYGSAVGQDGVGAPAERADARRECKRRTCVRPKNADDSFAQGFERRIREVASRAVAHVKRGDGVIVRTTLGDRVRADRTSGSDPVLRFLALLDPVDEANVSEVWASRRSRNGAAALVARVASKPSQTKQKRQKELS